MSENFQNQPTVSIEVSFGEGQRKFQAKKDVGASLSEFVALYGEQQTYVLACRMLRTDIQNRVRETMRKTDIANADTDLEKLVNEYKPSTGFRETDPEAQKKKIDNFIAAVNSGQLTPEALAQLKAALGM